MIYVYEEPSLWHDVTEPASQVDSRYNAIDPFLTGVEDPQSVLDDHQSAEAQSSDYQRRKDGFKTPDDFFDGAKHHQFIPNDSQTAPHRLSELQALHLSPVAQQPSKSLSAFQQVSAAWGSNDGATASYSFPPKGSMRTHKDLNPIDQIRAQIQTTAYEKNPQLAQIGISQSGSIYSEHQTRSSPAAMTASVHSDITSVACSIYHATRAFIELNVLYNRLITAENTEGSFIAEISSILYDCLQVRQAVSYRRNSAQSKLMRVYKIGLGFETCLKDLRDRKHTPSDLAFCLYTSGMLLNKATVVYSRKWYAEKRDTRRLDVCAEAMLEILCKFLPTANIVLYISEDKPSALPPWFVDEFLQKRLADGEIPGFPGNYHWSLDQNLPAFPSLPEHTRNSQGQFRELNDMFGRVGAVATGPEQPSNTTQTSDVQQSSNNTKTSQDSSHMVSDIMEIDWADWDRVFPSTQDRWSSMSSRPPIAEISSLQYELLQSRPPPTIQKLVPAEGTIAGGTEVTLLGSDFYEGLEIMFGEIGATSTTFWGDKCLNCVVPPASQPGSVKVRFKHEHHQILLTQQESKSRTCVYKYIGDHEAETQISGVVPESTSQQQITAELSATISTSSDSKFSPIMLTNLAIMKYLTECLATVDVSMKNEIQELVGRTLISLRCALEKGHLDDDTILSAILLWFIEKIRNDQRTAERHWDGIKVFIRLHPEFDIGVTLGRIYFLASLILTNQERKLLTVASSVLRVTFRSAVENGMETGDDNHRVAITSAPTPAATVYSPWSETDAEPPPYMLSPTPLKQACLIYAAVNART